MIVCRLDPFGTSHALQLFELHLSWFRCLPFVDGMECC